MSGQSTYVQEHEMTSWDKLKYKLMGRKSFVETGVLGYEL